MDTKAGRWSDRADELCDGVRFDKEPDLAVRWDCGVDGRHADERHMGMGW
jgi:hypothetical protein